MDNKQGFSGPTIFVSIEDNEVQVATNADLHPEQMRLMLEVAAKKLELMTFVQMMQMAAAQRAAERGDGLVIARQPIPRDL